MGTQGARQGTPGDLVLDAGALIAFERGDRELARVLKVAQARGYELIVPASALAQVWRGGPRSASLGLLMDAAATDPLDEGRAKEAGVRLGTRGGSDIADAHVVCCGLEYRAAVATSDPGDLRALSPPAERLVLIAV